MDREGTITLLSVILAGIPQLNGAACVGRHHLYDEIPGRGQNDQRRQSYQAAAGVCSRCPVPVLCPSRRA
jgi:hypothetical protein